MLERLTPEHGWKNASYDAWEVCGLDHVCKRDCWKPTPCEIPKMLYRLAEYENSGLSPKEVQELAKAKVEGRLLVPPVQVGDKIYHIGYSMKFGKKMIFTYTVSEVMYFSKRGERPWLFETYGGFRFDNLDIGEIVFLTYEEAQKVLERSGQDGSR